MAESAGFTDFKKNCQTKNYLYTAADINIDIPGTSTEYYTASTIFRRPNNRDNKTYTTINVFILAKTLDTECDTLVKFESTLYNFYTNVDNILNKTINMTDTSTIINILKIKLLHIPLDYYKFLEKYPEHFNQINILIHMRQIYQLFLKLVLIIIANPLYDIYKYAILLVLNKYMQKLHPPKPHRDTPIPPPSKEVKTIIYDFILSVNLVNIYSGHIINDIDYIKAKLSEIKIWYNTPANHPAKHSACHPVT